ncbi:MAG TPA: pseudouridine synthase [Azospirillaceae bacterium]|nr:pseudouridine synthase [Azospirillaceae bacterium]
MRYIAFNKPYGVLCQFTPEGGHPTLAGFGLPPGVYPAGRLDHDSEGLLLLTDDGRLIKRLLDPAHGHPRRYLAQVEGEPDDGALARLAAGGLVIQGHRTRPCVAARLDQDPDLWPRDPPIRFRKTVPTGWIALTLTEGKNRQVRRMTAAVGFPTLRLVRVAIGGLGLDGLAPGEWRDVAKADVLAGLR